MTRARRYAVVALVTALLIGLPVAWRLRPAPAVEVGAGALLDLVRDSRAPYSGFVVTQGTLQLPVASRFTDLGALLGEQNRLRVWWRDSEAWRVDRLVATGEEDLVHDSGQTVSYDYSDSEALVSTDPDIRLPRTADLLAPSLARRFLAGTDAAQATRLPTRRVAGIVAPGLRVEPADGRSSISHVDVWVDPDTGLALRLEVYGDSGDPALTSRFLSIDRSRPSADRVTFTPTATTEVSSDDVLDIADAADQYAPFRPPDTVAGLARSRSADGRDDAVGVYGGGLAQLIAIPLREREAGPLRTQVGVTPGSRFVETGTVVSVGPLGVLVTGTDDQGGYLIAGTVDEDTLQAAAVDLLEGTVIVGSRR